jgi:hypothetical protein
MKSQIDNALQAIAEELENKSSARKTPFHREKAGFAKFLITYDPLLNHPDAVAISSAVFQGKQLPFVLDYTPEKIWELVNKWINKTDGDSSDLKAHLAALHQNILTQQLKASDQSTINPPQRADQIFDAFLCDVYLSTQIRWGEEHSRGELHRYELKDDNASLVVPDSPFEEWTFSGAPEVQEIIRTIINFTENRTGFILILPGSDQSRSHDVTRFLTSLYHYLTAKDNDYRVFQTPDSFLNMQQAKFGVTVNVDADKLGLIPLGLEAASIIANIDATITALNVPGQRNGPICIITTEQEYELAIFQKWRSLVSRIAPYEDNKPAPIIKFPNHVDWDTIIANRIAATPDIDLNLLSIQRPKLEYVYQEPQIATLQNLFKALVNMAPGRPVSTFLTSEEFGTGKSLAVAKMLTLCGRARKHTALPEGHLPDDPHWVSKDTIFGQSRITDGALPDINRMPPGDVILIDDGLGKVTPDEFWKPIAGRGISVIALGTPPLEQAKTYADWTGCDNLPYVHHLSLGGEDWHGGTSVQVTKRVRTPAIMKPVQRSIKCLPGRLIESLREEYTTAVNRLLKHYDKKTVRRRKQRIEGYIDREWIKAPTFDNILGSSKLIPALINLYHEPDEEFVPSEIGNKWFWEGEGVPLLWLEIKGLYTPEEYEDIIRKGSTSVDNEHISPHKYWENKDNRALRTKQLPKPRWTVGFGPHESVPKIGWGHFLGTLLGYHEICMTTFNMGSSPLTPERLDILHEEIGSLSVANMPKLAPFTSCLFKFYKGHKYDKPFKRKVGTVYADPLNNPKYAFSATIGRFPFNKCGLHYSGHMFEEYPLLPPPQGQYVPVGTRFKYINRFNRECHELCPSDLTQITHETYVRWKAVI